MATINQSSLNDFFKNKRSTRNASKNDSKSTPEILPESKIQTITDVEEALPEVKSITLVKKVVKKPVRVVKKTNKKVTTSGNKIDSFFNKKNEETKPSEEVVCFSWLFFCMFYQSKIG